MKELFNGLWSIVYKEFLHIRRDRTSLIFALFTPMLQLCIFGFAVNYDVRHVKTILVDQDKTRESREYVQSLQNTQYLDIVSWADSASAASDALRRNEVRVAVIIPPNFSSASKPQIQVMLDGSDAQVANPARMAFSKPSSSDPPEVRARVLYNPNSRTAVYTIPGLVGVILQLVTVTLTAFSLVREKETGTLDQLMVTPIGRLGLMVGKLIPYACLATVEFVGVLFVAKLLFGVPIVGSVFLLAALALLFVIGSLSLGLLISTVSENQTQAMQLALLTMLPSILLSGYIAPRETLPGALYLLSNVFPVTHFIAIARGIMVRGAGLYDLLPSVFSLALIAFILMVVSALRFRKTVS